MLTAPQMADSNEILEYILKSPPTSLNPIAYSFLAPNSRGFESAVSILNQHPTSYDPFSDEPPSPSAKDQPRSNESAKDPTQSNPLIEMSVFAAATESFT